MCLAWLDDRPIMIAIAGSNGAGKTTFYEAHLKKTGLPLVNADRLAAEFDLAPYEAARLAKRVRSSLIQERESFVFETVFSDPVGDKIRFLEEVAASGYTVGLCFIGLSSAMLSAERVAMRVSQGGHDVPSEKLTSRFPRTLENLKSAISKVPHVFVFDNSDLARPYQRIASFSSGVREELAKPLPKWFQRIIPDA